MWDKTFRGKWKIIEMEKWDSMFIDLIEPGFFEFVGNGVGSFHFGCLYAIIAYRVDKQGRAEFSFQGDDEGDEIFGKGWAKINNCELTGHLFFDKGEQSGFRAEKKVNPIFYRQKKQRVFRNNRSMHFSY